MDPGGYYEIVHNKYDVNLEMIKKKLGKSLQTNYAKQWCEYHYKYINRCIYAEELLDDKHEDRLTDYKIYCFNGHPHCIMTCTNRTGKLKTTFYSLDWKYLDYEEGGTIEDAKVEKPKSLAVMLQAAEVLSKEFPFARVDFYDVDGKAYFGEITLTPANCHLKYINANGQKTLGDLLKLPV